MAESDVGFKDTNSDSRSHIPEDLLHFIRRDTYSLLVKGFAGTGKTTLALTILNVLGIKNNFFYISTRISPKQLFQYYPWLKDFIEQSKPQGTSLARDHEVMSSFEDARLDEPESLFERITNQLMDIKSPIIIIDSWDAIASFMDREARLNNERVLQTWRERAGAKLIFISEQPADTTLDFLVDGIVELKQSYYNNVKMRQIFLQKLRGTRIKRPSYLYTLENSIFHSFAPYRPIKFEPGRRSAAAHVSELSTGDNIGSGYPMLDASLGSGFPKKGVVLLELDSHVNMTIAIIFLQRIVSNFVSSGNAVLLQPVNWMEPSSILRFFETSMPAGKKRSLFKILSTCKPDKISNNIISLGKNQSPNQLLATLVKMKQSHRDKLLLNIMWADAIQSLYGARRARDGMKNILSRILAHADLSIAVLTRSQEDILELVSQISNIHLRFMMINDTLFLQSIVPSSNLYSLVFDRQSQMSLKPVV
ncbi:MAG TPA: gas vesicle protein GvpD P-loop domain-containing protein [Nitrososphaera sp.]|nr:gas vesicle protein GvpD P-loop domain-containing protein [Nitrososphaera sp.]